MARPKFEIIDSKLIDQIITEGILLLEDPGIKVHNQEALTLLAEGGSKVNFEAQIASIPEKVVRTALSTAPHEFFLYDLKGDPVIHYYKDEIHFDPGSAGIAILDSQSERPRSPVTPDFIKFVKLVETLPQIDAQSTALICSDVVKDIGDLYRLYLALNFMNKPIITGAFRKDTWWTMKEMLSIVAGGDVALAAKPIAVFDACPSPPLLWSDTTCQNLIDCARFSIPAELISMPLAGATAPATLLGAVVQHAAESLSGIVIHQLANKGAPIVWGGSPAVFDMREGTTPMGAVGTWMIDATYAQVGKALDLPTHAYLGMSDSKIVDTQCGLESMGGALIAGLVGINMISGSGMLEFESCQSYEKLVIDAEIIGMTKHLIAGMNVRDDPIALQLMRKCGHKGDYLAQLHTRKMYKLEQYIPSAVIDRASFEGWRNRGSKSAFERAREHVDELLISYQPSPLSEETLKELRDITQSTANKFGMGDLPPLTEA